MNEKSEENKGTFDSEYNMIKEHQNRYVLAAHAMQSGVATVMSYDKNETSPKHLRIGINSAMVENGAIVKLLIDKGIITEEEWYQYLADGMETEAHSYEKEIAAHYGGGVNIKLG